MMLVAKSLATKSTSNLDIGYYGGPEHWETYGLLSIWSISDTPKPIGLVFICIKLHIVIVINLLLSQKSNVILFFEKCFDVRHCVKPVLTNHDFGLSNSQSPMVFVQFRTRCQALNSQSIFDEVKFVSCTSYYRKHGPPDTEQQVFAVRLSERSEHSER